MAGVALRPLSGVSATATVAIRSSRLGARASWEIVLLLAGHRLWNGSLLKTSVTAFNSLISKVSP